MHRLLPDTRKIRESRPGSQPTARQPARGTSPVRAFWSVALALLTALPLAALSLTVFSLTVFLLTVFHLAVPPVALSQVNPTKISRGFQTHQLNLEQELAEVHAYDLNGDGRKELILIEVDNADRARPHRVRVLRQGPRGFSPLPEAAAALPPEVAATGVGRFFGVPGLAMILPRGVEVWPWRGKRFRRAQAARRTMDTLFIQAGGALKRGLNWVVDVDGDGADELAVPVPDGFDLLRAGRGGSLTRMAAFAQRPRSRLWNSLHRSLLAVEMPTVDFLPASGGLRRRMLVYDDGLVSLFPLKPGTGIPPNGGGNPSIPDTAKGIAEAGTRPPWRLDFQPPQPFDPRAPEDPPLRLVSAEDLNLDGVFDLIFAKNAATDSTFRTSTRILVHYGRQAPGESGPNFDTKPDQVFVSEGFTFPILLDLNRDRRTDMVLVNVEVGFWNAIKAFIAKSVTAEAAFYLMPKEGRFTQQPDKLVDYTVTFTLGRDTHRPLVAFGDFNGDGLPDLLLSKDKETLGLHWGLPEGLWRGDSDEEVAGFLPVHQRNLLVQDLDGDGRDDMIFRFGRKDYRQMPEINGRFAVLLSRYPYPKEQVAHAGYKPAPKLPRPGTSSTKMLIPGRR